ncbi:MAG TPA: hypothetical protein VFH27_09095 [Longimicrobiaceae bacterium]|nr:hypothetical protein [Longimicrobiaceae bacterium]
MHANHNRNAAFKRRVKLSHMRIRLLTLLLALAAAPLPAQRLPVRRLSAGGLELHFAGVALVRDSARLAQLYARFPRMAHEPTGRLFRASPPAVDFRSEMVVVVSLGVVPAGCSNDASYVRGAKERRDSIVVELGDPPVEHPEQLTLTCMMVVYPREVVAIPRSGKPVAFHAPPGWVRTPTWWWTPSIAELRQMPRDRRTDWLLALARDPATPPRMAVALARNFAAEHDVAAELLMERKEVQRDPAAASAIALADRPRGALRDRFVRLHGVSMAGAARTPRPVLDLFMEHLDINGGARVRPLAESLLRNPAVQGDSTLLGRFTYVAQQFDDLREKACRVYHARWTGRYELLYTDGRRTGTFGTSVNCPAPPRGAPR